MTTQGPGTLADRSRGQVIRPDDAGYEEARHVYNAMIEARPHLIVRCAGTDDVVAAAARTAQAGGGTTWGRFNDATAASGLATTGGIISTTGIGGLTSAAASATCAAATGCPATTWSRPRWSPPRATS